MSMFAFAPTQHLMVSGLYDDGIARDVTASASGTTYLSADPSVASVDAEGVVASHRIGATSITVSHGGFSTSVAVHVVSVALRLRMDGDALSWPDAEFASSYDVVRGSLAVLRATGGDFSAATDLCVASHVTVTGTASVPDPPAGNGYWYLVRFSVLAGPLTYDEIDFGSASQVGSRDLGIAASSAACP
jgi:hypothetical protein